MRLNEIKDIRRGADVTQHYPEINPLKDRVGGGQDATAFKHPTNPGSILKISKPLNRYNRNPHVDLAKTFMKYPNNPFFPKIYQADFIDDLDADLISLPAPKPSRVGDREEYFLIEMEKLHPMDSDKLIHMVPQLLRQIGVPENYVARFAGSRYDPKKGVQQVPRKVGMKDVSDITKPSDEREYEMQIRNLFTTIFKNKDELQKVAARSKNQQFKEAVSVLMKLSKSYDLDLHRHTDNMMFRLTPHGPQLVLIDPFWGMSDITKKELDDLMMRELVDQEAENEPNWWEK